MSASESDLTERLYEKADAAVWAEEFVTLFGSDTIDFGLMVGWFANAMEIAKRDAGDRYDEGYNDGQRDTAHALMGLDRSGGGGTGNDRGPDAEVGDSSGEGLAHPPSVFERLRSGEDVDL